MDGKLDINTIKKLEFDLLCSVCKFCNDNNLRYYLCAGTLLGAIRHKGFIPWDDDIDIQMPRPDYDYLIENFKSTNNIKILSPGYDNYYYNFAKAIDARTRLCELNLKPIDSYGVYIDIFPIEGMPDNETERLNHFKKLDSIRNRINRYGYGKPVLRKNLYLYFKQWITYFSNNDHKIKNLQKEYIDLAHLYDYNSSNYVYVSGGGYHIKEIYSKDVFANPVLVEFEGESFNAPKEWDKYLHQLYGDYMTLPPEDKRVSNHKFFAEFIDK